MNLTLSLLQQMNMKNSNSTFLQPHRRNLTHRSPHPHRLPPTIAPLAQLPLAIAPLRPTGKPFVASCKPRCPNPPSPPWPKHPVQIWFFLLLLHQQRSGSRASHYARRGKYLGIQPSSRGQAKN
ncbi:hypothetical protein QJS10_CPB20g00540 [Acorus calamus]|uniref:Uncharacterized protein n=1 Tax=Acorus calamus TaxID=4465 RepID=A0AAV9C7T8_ACOCL|nr:hypothetical protein QJS10_CPB20g00540 [Acorus calamus]